MKKGKTPKSASSKAAKVAQGMNLADLKEFAETKRKGLPKKAGKPTKPAKAKPKKVKIPSAKQATPAPKSVGVLRKL